jgi:hypothetical protein
MLHYGVHTIGHLSVVVAKHSSPHLRRIPTRTSLMQCYTLVLHVAPFFQVSALKLLCIPLYNICAYNILDLIIQIVNEEWKS